MVHIPPRSSPEEELWKDVKGLDRQRSHDANEGTKAKAKTYSGAFVISSRYHGVPRSIPVHTYLQP